MKPRWEHVVIVCPERVTGGPEALHQLAHEIQKLGGNSSLAYVWGPSLTVMDGETISCDFRNSKTAEVYKDYWPAMASAVPLVPSTLVVFPEVLTTSVTSPQFGKATKAVWWLSVDLAFTQNPQLHIAATLRDLLQRDALHFYQSTFAGRWLATKGVGEAWPLSDYTPNMFFNRLGANPPRRKVAVYLNRCNDLMVQFLEANPDLEYFKIDRMPREEVIAGLRECAVYLDFGSSSGKDRVPREAAACGCVVLLHNDRASAVFEDHPLGRTWKFTRGDVENGWLASGVRSILRDPMAAFCNQATYRWQVANEAEVFRVQVRAAFFVG